MKRQRHPKWLGVSAWDAEDSEEVKKAVHQDPSLQIELYLPESQKTAQKAKTALGVIHFTMSENGEIFVENMFIVTRRGKDIRSGWLGKRWHHIQRGTGIRSLGHTGRKHLQ